MAERTLIICLDDVGFDILADTPTPNIDTLIRAGQSHLLWTTPTCSPTRACLMTGLYPFHSGIGTILREPEHEELPPELVSLPPGMNAMIGKWHLGEHTNPTHPIECGFDVFDGHLHNFRGSQRYDRWKRVQAVNRNGSVEVNVATETAYATRAMSESAIEAMKDAIDQVFLSYAAIHKPWHVAPYGHDMTPANPYEKAQSMLRALDHDLGLVMSAAVQLGYRVLLFSDNGTPPPLRGGKGSLYENGIRNLCVTYQWPTLPDNALLHTVDLMPLVDGVMRPDSVAIGRRHFLYTEKFSPNLAEPFDDAWSWAIRDQRWKLIQLAPAHNEEKVFKTLLFDLQEDPTEETNVLDDHADEARRLNDEVERIHAGKE